MNMKRFCQAMRSNAFLVALILPLLLKSPLLAQPDPAPKKVATIEGITEYKLDNGLKVLLYPDPSSSRVTVNLTVLVGSRHEGYGETGMAHLLEHMLFKGTPTHPNVPKVLRDHGANFNGTTTYDRTNYFQTMRATDENLEFAIRLEADRLVNSFVKNEDLKSEMTVVRSEFEAGENNPVGIMFQRMLAASYEWHNYGKTTIGNRSDIERVPIEKLQVFYRKYYQPDNAVLIISGQFDEKKTLGWIAKYFGDLKKPERKLDATYTEEPPQDGEREVILRRVGKVGATGAMYHIPAASHPDFAALEVLANIFDYEPDGILYKALVPTKKATSVNAFAYDLHDPGLFIVIAQVDGGDEKSVRAALDTLVTTTEADNTKAFTREEVERSRRKLLRDRELAMADVNRIGITLSDWTARGDWKLFLLHRDRLEKVTPEDVARVAKKYLQKSNRTAGLYIPSKETTRTPVPPTPSVDELLQGYQGRKAIAAGEALDPSPKAIEARTKRLTLPSGIKAALLPKKTRADAVHLMLTLRFGNEQSLKGWTSPAEFVGAMMQRGTKDMTRKEIDDTLAKLKATIGINSEAGGLVVNVQCNREALPEVLKLVGKMLREPSFPASEFEVIKRQILSRLEESKTNPQLLAQRAMRRFLAPTEKDSIYYVPTEEEEIAQVKDVTLDKVKQLHAEQLGGQHGELAAVGDFDLDTLVKQVGEFLDGWKSETPYRRVPREAYPDRKPEMIAIPTPDKANAIYIAVKSLALKDDNPDYPALQVGNYLLGAAPLASRLSNRVRGKDGLSYGVGSQINARALDPVGIAYVFAICNPVNIDKVDSAIKEEIDRFLTKGVEEKELNEGIKAYLELQKNSRGSEPSLMAQLAGTLATGRTMEFTAEREKIIAALTVDQVNSAFSKHIDPKRLTYIRAGDFSKKPKQ
jgi:zinc protease